MQGGRSAAQASRRIAAALGSRVGFHAPDPTDLDGCTVQGACADHEADMGHQLSFRGEHQDTIGGRSPSEVSTRTHRYDVWGVDRRCECLERGALVIVERCDRFKVNTHRPSESIDSVERSWSPNARGEPRLEAVGSRPLFG
jgi:hypothetical protein